ncbi:hypothetical protein K8I85_06420 [bacterium]|nr:hypothetical protein [bacterium]
MTHEARANRALPRTAWIAALLALALCIPAATPADEIAIHGFLSQGYMGTRDYDYLARSSEGTFQFSEMGINCSSVVREDLRIGMQIFARDLGDLGNNTIELDWAYGDYSWRNELGFRAGKIKMPYGLYNETRDVDALRTAVLMPQGVYDQRFRDFLVAVTGAALYGSTPWTAAGSLDYQAFWGMTNLAVDASVAQLLNATGLITVRNFDSYHSGGAVVVWNAPVQGLRLGTTISHFDWAYDTELAEPVLAQLSPLGAQPIETVRSRNTRLLTTSGEYTWGNLLLAAEHTLWLGRLMNPYVGVDLNREGWYGLASYRFCNWLEAGSYYSVFYDDRDDREGATKAIAHMGYQKDLTTSLRFDMNDFWMLKAELHFIRGTASLLETDNFGEGGERWTLITGKTSFVF